MRRLAALVPCNRHFAEQLERTIGFGMFLPAHSRKKSNAATWVEPSMPMWVCPLSLPLNRGSSALSDSAGPTLRVGLAFIASTAA